MVNFKEYIQTKKQDFIDLAKLEEEFIKTNPKPDPKLVCNKHLVYADWKVESREWILDNRLCEKCELAKSYLSNMQKLHIPLVYGDLEPDFSFDAIIARGKGRMFLGSPNSGKSYKLAQIALANEVKFQPVIELSDDYRSLGDNPEKSVKWKKKIKTSELLLIDDLGKEKPSEYWLSCLFDIFDYRYNYMLPTFITSNLTRSEINRIYGDAIFSRMFDRGNDGGLFEAECVVFEKEGSNYSQKILKYNKNDTNKIPKK